MIKEHQDTVTVLVGDAEENWTLTVIQDDDEEIVTLRLREPGGTHVIGRGDNSWDALRSLRQEIEPDGLRICCNGARVNAWVSGMGISMLNGGFVYLTRIGWPARRTDLVEIFAYAPPGKVGSLEQQAQFHERWLRSNRAWWKRFLGISQR